MTEPRPEFPTAWNRALLLATFAAIALGALRWAQLRSVEALLYHGEFTGLGRRIVDLYGGGEPPVFQDFHAFWDRYQYQTYAQGTVYTQVAGAWFARWLGPSTKALHATTVVAECLAVFVASALAFRTLRLRWAWVVVAAFVFLPVIAVGWQLAPYGNHTEFQAVPVFLAAFLATTSAAARDRGSLLRWLPVAVAIAFGLVMYRGNAPPVIAFAATVLWTRSWGRAGRGLATVVLAGLGAYWVLAYGIGADLTGIGPESFGAEQVPSIVVDGAQQHSLAEAAATVFRESLPGAPRWIAGGAPARVLLGLGWLLAAMSWLPARGGEITPGRLLARYASLWAFGAVAAVLVGRQAFPRYLIGAYYALLLCWTGVLVAASHVALRGLAAGALGLIALGGLLEGWYWVVPAMWDATDDLNGIPLWFELEVNYIDLDELPYYQRVLDEGRGTKWIGWSSHHMPMGCVVQGALVAQPDYFPRPSLDACHGFDPATAQFIADEAERELDRNPQFDFEASMREVGVGMWIRSDHDMGVLLPALEGMRTRLRRPILAGAAAEATGWRQ